MVKAEFKNVLERREECLSILINLNTVAYLINAYANLSRNQFLEDIKKEHFMNTESQQQLYKPKCLPAV